MRQEALSALKKAADGGLAEDLYNLGMLYDQGIGCEQSHDTALDYYCRKAVYKGHGKSKRDYKRASRRRQDSLLAYNANRNKSRLATLATIRQR